MHCNILSHEISPLSSCTKNEIIPFVEQLCMHNNAQEQKLHNPS